MSDDAENVTLHVEIDPLPTQTKTLRLIEWDFDHMRATEYKRIGACNGCGCCCFYHVSYMVEKANTDVDHKKFGGTPFYDPTYGVWQEVIDPAVDKPIFRRLTQVLPQWDPLKRCTQLNANNTCMVHNTPEQPQFCKYFPVSPRDIRNIHQCGYKFEIIDQWTFETPVLERPSLALMQERGVPIMAATDGTNFWDPLTKDELHNVFATTFLGISCDQFWADLYLFEKLFYEEKFEKVLELGTFAGGLSLFLLLECMQHKMQFFTYDFKPEYADGAKQSVIGLLAGLRGYAFEGDILNGQARYHVETLLGYPERGRVLLLCDGGNKAEEFKLYAPKLRTGDMIAAHDYPCEFQDHHILPEHLEILEEYTHGGLHTRVGSAWKWFIHK